MGSLTVTEQVTYEITDERGPTGKGKVLTVSVFSDCASELDWSSPALDDSIEMLANAVDPKAVIRARAELADRMKADPLAAYGREVFTAFC